MESSPVDTNVGMKTPIVCILTLSNSNHGYYKLYSMQAQVLPIKLCS